MVVVSDASSIVPGEVHVWYADLTAETGKLPVECLSVEEHERAGKYRFEEDRRRFVIARYFLRSILSCYKKQEPGDISFGAGPAGKPRLKGEPPAGLRFNLSHSGEIAVVVVACGREVGVDVERMCSPSPEVETFRQYLAPGELAAIDALKGFAKAHAFFRAWTRKEALLKATGEGLGGLGPDLDLSAGSDFLRMGKAWHVTDLDLTPDYAAALAVEGPACAVRLYPWRP